MDELNSSPCHWRGPIGQSVLRAGTCRLEASGKDWVSLIDGPSRAIFIVDNHGVAIYSGMRNAATA
jgi:hypothetical protein